MYIVATTCLVITTVVAIAFVIHYALKAREWEVRAWRELEHSEMLEEKIRVLENAESTLMWKLREQTRELRQSRQEWETALRPIVEQQVLERFNAENVAEAREKLRQKAMRQKEESPKLEETRRAIRRAQQRVPEEAGPPPIKYS